MSAIQLRAATIDDMESLFHWRNAPEVRATSFSTEEIPWASHQAWFRRMLDDTSRHLLIGEIGDDAIGVIRFDIVAAEAEISIYLVPGLSGRGFGTQLLQAATAWASTRIPGLQRVLARVRDENQASLKAFKKAGFHPYRDILAWDAPPRHARTGDPLP
jgi:RimJ/RimL family protein N-acetyltransferase